MRLSYLLAIVTGLAIAPGPARAYDLLGDLFATFPGCDAPHVVERVKSRFNNSARYGLEAQIASIEYRSERRYEAFGPRPILRRFCRGEAYLANGRKTTIHYLIERQMGFAGTGYNVEFCLTGHDPWRVYGGGCRVLRR